MGLMPTSAKTHLLIALGTVAAEAGRGPLRLASKLVNELVEAADDKHPYQLITR